MSNSYIWLGLFTAYVLTAIAEGRRHRMNYRFLLGRGAEETAPGLMKIYYASPWLIFAFAIVEGYFNAQQATSSTFRLVALTLIISGFLLRVWVIHSLGWLWTMRCLHRTGFPVISTGPYRWFPHPEYAARLLEISGFCLFLNSMYTLSFSLVFWIFAIAAITQREKAQMATFQVEGK